MTNEEAIKKINELFNEKMFWDDSIESYNFELTKNFIISTLEENTKLKAEIEELRGKYNNLILSSEIHAADRRLIEENEKLKKEIENLLVDKECWTCKHEELSPLSEPCYSCDDCVNWERKG